MPSKRQSDRNGNALSEKAQAAMRLHDARLASCKRRANTTEMEIAQGRLDKRLGGQLLSAYWL